MCSLRFFWASAGGGLASPVPESQQELGGSSGTSRGTAILSHPEGSSPESAARLPGVPLAWGAGQVPTAELGAGLVGQEVIPACFPGEPSRWVVCE